MDENKKLVLSINGAERKEDKIVLPAYSGVWLVGKEYQKEGWCQGEDGTSQWVEVYL